LTALAAVFFSGILLQLFQEVLAIQMIHKLSSTILVAGVIVHVIQHLISSGQEKNRLKKYKGEKRS